MRHGDVLPWLPDRSGRVLHEHTAHHRADDVRSRPPVRHGSPHRHLGHLHGYRRRLLHALCPAHQPRPRAQHHGRPGAGRGGGVRREDEAPCARPVQRTDAFCVLHHLCRRFKALEVGQRLPGRDHGAGRLDRKRHV